MTIEYIDQDDFDPRITAKKGVRAIVYGVVLPILVGMASKKGIPPEAATPAILGLGAMARNFVKRKWPRAFGWL